MQETSIPPHEPAPDTPGPIRERTTDDGLRPDEQAEHDARERFDLLFHASPAPTALTALDDANTFVEVNDAFLQALGFTRDEVIGRTAEDLALFVHLEEQEDVARRLIESGSFRGAKLRVRAKDGRILEGIFSGEVVHLDGGAYLLSVMRDDTERHRAEQALRELNSHLEQRIEERTRQLERAHRDLTGLVDSIAHDLRAPLRTIGSFGQILQQEHAEEFSEEAADAVRRIVRANGRMERLIDALLDLSGLTRRRLRIADTDLTGLVHEVVADLREGDPERTVEVTVEDGMRLDADPALTRILIENLLHNAWKFTAGQDTAHIEVGRRWAGGQWVYFVRDDGVGFDQRYAGRLFAPFESLHDGLGGTGIGLATVQRVAERHNGSAWAVGTVGAGATFSFTLSPPAG